MDEWLCWFRNQHTSFAMAWTAAIVDAYTQSGKTFKTFDVLAKKLVDEDPTLVIFITQASSVASTRQLIGRIRKYPTLKFAVCQRISELDVCQQGASVSNHVCLVDFFHRRNLEMAVKFVQETQDGWKHIIVVIDECDAGGYAGLTARLDFLREIETAAPSSKVHVIFITATVANLCKSLVSVAHHLGPHLDGIVKEIVQDPCVEHYHVEPHESYVGPSWFKDNHAWREIVFPSRKDLKEGMGVEKVAREDVIRAEWGATMQAIENIPLDKKHVSLIAISTRVEDHRELSMSLLNRGYNVTVELNGTQPMANYNVHFRDRQDDDTIHTWVIPMTRLVTLANQGELSTVKIQGKEYDTGILDGSDLSMGLVLCASLMNMTHEHPAPHMNPQEYALLAIQQALEWRVPKGKRRPLCYPHELRIAIIAGHLASRGITFQMPSVGFACTSFVFVHSPDTAQRGATNTQKMGRACGLLGEIFAIPEHRPLLLATSRVMCDALANEAILKEKAQHIKDGETIRLQDFVSAEDWQAMLTNVKLSLRTKKTVDTSKNKTKIKKTNACPLARMCLRKEGIGANTIDYVLATEYTTLKHTSFEERYSLANVNIRDAAQLAIALHDKGVDAHISIAETSAKTVSDLANFWRNPSWCHKPWQVIVHPDDSITMIKRNVDLLHNIQDYMGRVVAGHTYLGDLQYWRVV